MYSDHNTSTATPIDLSLFSTSDTTMLDSLFSSLSSSLQSVNITLGITDSLTIAKRTVRLSDSSNDYHDNDQENGDGDDLMMVDDDDIDAAWQEFYSSWEEVMKVDKVIKKDKSSPSSSLQSTRRSGVRRGQTETVPAEMIVIPTKCYDGPSLTTTNNANQHTAQKQRAHQEA